MCQSWDYVYGLLMTRLFAWISLTALSRTYFITQIHHKCPNCTLQTLMIFDVTQKPLIFHIRITPNEAT